MKKLPFRPLAMLGLLALATMPLSAAEPENPNITMPARETYRSPIESSGKSSDGKQYARHIKMTVTPAEFPRPLLKYRFNIYSTELETGNAVPLYSQAYAEYQRIYGEAEKKWYASNTYFDLKKSGASDDKIRQELFHTVPLKPVWPYTYPKSVSPEEEAKFYQSMEPVDRLLEKASRMRDADWSYRVEFKGIATSFGFVQDMRALARYISGKADWQIRNGKYEEAAKTIRIGIALSGHLTKTTFPTLIVMFVGVAIQGMMQERIMDMSSQPDGPNLYPALTQIILPADALQYALQGEQSLCPGFSAKNSLQAVEDLDRATPEQCRQKLVELATLFQAADSHFSDHPDKADSSIFLAMSCTLFYPSARERLLALGRTPNGIEKLAVYQVVAPYVFEEIRAAYDRVLVSATFPPGSSHTAINIEKPRLHDGQSPLDSYLTVLMLIEPSLAAAQRAQMRMQQGLELLKIIEAIRYYAAVHGGQIPRSLADIKEVVIAINDPVTGKPFGYQVQGRTAIIDFTNAVANCRFEVTVEEPAVPLKAAK